MLAPEVRASLASPLPPLAPPLPCLSSAGPALSSGWVSPCQFALTQPPERSDDPSKNTNQTMPVLCSEPSLALGCSENKIQTWPSSPTLRPHRPASPPGSLSHSPLAAPTAPTGGWGAGVLPVPVALSVCNILPLEPHGVASFLPFGSQFKCHLLQEALSDPLTMLASSLYLLDQIYFLYNTHGPLLIPFVCWGLSCLSLDQKLGHMRAHCMFCSPLHSQCSAQGLAHSRCSTIICRWTDEWRNG